MLMNCTVIRDEYGYIQDVLTQTGDKSNLYYDLLFKLNDPEAALKAYALTLTPSFNNRMGNSQLNKQGEHTLATYEAFVGGQISVAPSSIRLEKRPDVDSRGNVNIAYDVIQNNKVVGQIVLNAFEGHPISNSYSIAYSEINTPGQGIGTKAYTALNTLLKKEGKKLVSDTSRTDAAENLWASFERKGLAKKVEVGKAEVKVSTSSRFKIDTAPKRSDYVYEFTGTSTQSGIKPGVKELFESNPELANAVYEALGFNSSELDINKRPYLDNINSGAKDSEFINLYRAEGAVVNKENLPISIRGNAGSWFTPNIKEAKRYASYGDRNLYKIAIPKALYDGLLASRKGQTLEISKGEIQLPENISKLKENISQITPQQKQQAQQLYSQYLDTGRQDIEGFKDYVKSATEPAINEDIFNYSFAKFLEEESYSIDEEHFDTLKRVKSSTPEQNKVLNKVLSDHSKVIKQLEDGKHGLYMKDPTSDTNVRLKGVTRVLEADPLYKYYGTTKDNKHTAWGNVIDTIMNEVIAGKSVTDTINKLREEDTDFENIVSIPAVINTHKKFKELIKSEEEQGNIILTQVKIPSLEKQVVGIADVFIIQPDGKIKIYDVKTSHKSFVDGGYKKEYPVKGQTDKISTFKKHSAQLSIMAAMAEANGLEVADRSPIAVIPVKLLTDEINYRKVTSAIFETPLIEADFIGKLRDKYGIKNNLREKMASTLEKIMSQLENVVEILIRRKQYDTANELKQFIKDAKDKADGLDKVVERMHLLMFGNNYTAGYVTLVDRYLDELEGDNITDALQKLDLIEKELDLMYPVGKTNMFKEYNRLLDETNATMEEGSINYKLKQVTNAIDNLRTKLHNDRPMALAALLAKQLPPNFNNNIEKEYQRLLSRYNLATTDKAKDKAKKKLDDYIWAYNIDETTGKVDNVSFIYNQMKNGKYFDVYGLDRWTGTVTQSPVAFAALFARLVKNDFEDARINTLKTARKLEKEYEEFNRTFNQSTEELYDEMLEVRTVYGETNKTILSFVDIIDRNAYNKSRYDAYQKAKELREQGKYKDAATYMQNWYAENTQARPQDDVVENGVVIIEGINSIYKRKAEQLGRGSDKFLAWEADNKKNDMYIRELAMPKITKYRNPRYDALKKSGKFKMYTNLLGKYFEAQKKQPQRGASNFEELKYYIPNIQKHNLDNVVSTATNAWSKTKEAFKFNASEDEDVYGIEGDNIVNVLFLNTRNPLPVDLVSRDMTNSVMQYIAAANKYEKQVQLSSIGDAVLSTIENVKARQPDFNVLVDEIKKGINKKPSDSKLAEQLKGWIDGQIYGKTKIKQKFKYTNIEGSKAVNALTRFASLTVIAAKPILAISNALMANTQSAIESLGNQVYGVVNWARATTIYTGNITDLALDSVNVTKKTKIGMIVEAFDPLQGTAQDKMLNKMGRSAVKTATSFSTLYAGMEFGEHSSQVISLIAALLNKTVKVREGNSIKDVSMYDALVVKDGTLQLKDGIITTGLNLRDGFLDVDLQNKVHSVNTRLQGIYNTFEAPDIQRQWYGNGLLLYKKWLPQGLKSRFKKEGYDYMLDEFTYGTYTSMFKLLYESIKELNKVFEGNFYDKYNPAQIAAAKKALAELGIMIGTAILYNLLDDEEEEQSKLKKWTLYAIFRLNQELAFYGLPGNPLSGYVPNPKQLWIQLTTVSALTATVESMIDILINISLDGLDLTFGRDIERYKRTTPMFDKGTSKTLAKIAKLFGYSNTRFLLDADEAIRLLELQRGAVEGK